MKPEVMRDGFMLKVIINSGIAMRHGVINFAQRVSHRFEKANNDTGNRGNSYFMCFR